MDMDKEKLRHENKTHGFFYGFLIKIYLRKLYSILNW